MNSKWILVALTSVLLAACSDDKFKGKTAEQWANEAQTARAALAATKPIVQAPKAEVDDGTEKRRKLQEAADAAYLTEVDAAADAIFAPKSGDTLVLTAATEAVSRFDNRQPGGSVVFGRLVWEFTDQASEALVPQRTARSELQPDYQVVQLAGRKFRSAAIKWAISDPARVNALWAALRPSLRQQYDLLTTLRGHAPLFSVVYTRKAFEPLTECLMWYDGLANVREGKGLEVSEGDTKRCNALLKQFGIKAEFGSASRDNLSARNALWLVRFFARRDADGGEKFPQQIQKFMADYIK